MKYRWLGKSGLQVSELCLGAMTLEQLKDNIGSVGWELTSEELETLDKVSRLEWGYPYQFQRESERIRT